MTLVGVKKDYIVLYILLLHINVPRVVSHHPAHCRTRILINFSNGNMRKSSFPAYFLDKSEMCCKHCYSLHIRHINSCEPLR